MIERSLPAGPHHVVKVRCSNRNDGDFRVDGPAAVLADRRAGFAPGAWTWLHQVHGSHVIVVKVAGDGAGTRGDGCVTAAVGAVLAVQTADCAPVVFSSDALVGIVHSGWRGIVEGVIPAVLAEMRVRGAAEIHALLGPCIASGAYAFGAAELAAVAAVAGDGVRARTTDGDLALDLPAAVRSVCVSHDVAHFDVIGVPGATTPFDTSGPDWFSHRARADRERQVTTARLESR